MSESLPDVILLRSADEPDPYVQAFAEAGIRAECRPVLRFAFPAKAALRSRLREADRYAGLVATSPRAARALRHSFEAAPSLRRAWNGRPAYAVGPKTGARLRALGLEVRGEEAGDAETLATMIADQAPSDPLLFLSGNRRRDALPNGLRAADVPFDELVVYETHPRADLILPSPDADGWLAFFSPSGLEALRNSGIDPGAHFRCAAIGPTTAGALRDAGVAVEATANEPSPEGLVRAISGAATDEGGRSDA